MFEFYRVDFMMSAIMWDKYPLALGNKIVKEWLLIQLNLGLANNTLSAYARAIEEYLVFCGKQSIDINMINRNTVAQYVNYLTTKITKSGQGYSNATLQQKFTTLRLYYDYLVEEGVIGSNPIGRGKYTLGRLNVFAIKRGIIPRFHKLPWIPNSEEWLSVVSITKEEPIRNRLMLAFAYDGAMRREELCLLETSDIDPAYRSIRIRTETTKNRQERVVCYSLSAADLLSQYLRERHSSSKRLFLSESKRNNLHPISMWTWSKVVRRIAIKAQLPQFSTHTLRHLCLTDLAQSGWDIHEIATFAGHRSTMTTMQYIHLSGREIAAKYEQSMASLKIWS